MNIQQTELNKIVLIAFAGGGFLWETRQLLSKIAGRYSYYYVTTYDTMLPKDGSIPSDRVDRISGVTSRSRNSVFFKIIATAVGFLKALRIMLRIRPAAVICVGTSIAVPVFLAAKALRRKTCFVESIARADELSATAKILIRLKICDKLYVQWPDLDEGNGLVVYRGSVI